MTAAGLDADQARAWVAAVAERIVAEASALDRLDAVGGDGDHGTTMASGWQAARLAVEATGAGAGAGQVLAAAATAFAAAAGGTAGHLLGGGLSAMAGTTTLADGLDALADAVRIEGGAAVGDRSLLDALVPAADAARAGDGARGAALAAAAGAERTVDLAARVGRARAVEGGGRGSADPGATSIATALAALADVLEGGTSLPPLGDTAARPRPRKLLNDVADAVDQMIDGLVAAHGHRVARGSHPRIVARAVAKPDGHVALVIGNGSGHEPIAVGWVGHGLLDANACGDVFTAPPAALLAETIVGADRGAGVLVLVSQHDGDVLTAREAVAQARAAGTRVEALHMYDDVATAPPERRHERRGAPGTTFLYKVLGAAAEEGMDLDDLRTLGARLRDQTATISLGLGAGTSPLTGEPTHHVDPGTVVVGTGVHGEGGSATLPLAPADELVDILLDRLLADLPFVAGDEVLVLVNGAGGTTLLELLVVHRAVDARLRAEGLVPFHPLVGELVTTQEAAGISLSLARTDPEIRRLWLAPCDAPYFPSPGVPYLPSPGGMA